MATSFNGNEKKNTVTILWEIENAILLVNKHEHMVVKSPNFLLETIERRVFVLELVPKFVVKAEKFVFLNFYLLNDTFSFPIDLEWSFLGGDGLPVVGGTDMNIKPEENAMIAMDGLPTYKEVFVTRRSTYFKNNTLTIQFRIRKSFGDLSADEFISCRSRLESMEDSILWNIQEFSLMPLNAEYNFPVALESPEGTDNFLWRFTLEGESLLTSNVILHFSCYTVPITWEITLKVSLLDGIQNVVKTFEERPPLLGNLSKVTWKSLKLMSRKELLEKSSQLLKNDALTLLCEVFVIDKTCTIRTICFNLPNLQFGDLPGFPSLWDLSCQTSEEGSDPSPNNHQEISVELLGKKLSSALKLSLQTSKRNDDETAVSVSEKDSKAILVDDLLGILYDRSLTDFEIRCGKFSFPVHKNILIARSPVLKTKLSSSQKEPASYYMDATDIDYYIMDRLLIFLYSGKAVPLNSANALKLYYAAVQYKVESLKRDCCSFLQYNIDFENVRDLLILADKHEELSLKSFVHRFIMIHYDKIIKSPQWDEFLKTNTKLADQTTLEVFMRKLEMRKLVR